MGIRERTEMGKEGLLDMLDRPSLFSSSLRGGDPSFVDQSNRERNDEECHPFAVSGSLCHRIHR